MRTQYAQHRMLRFVALLLVLLAGTRTGLAVSVLVGAEPKFVLKANEYLDQSGNYLLMQSDCNAQLYNSALQPILATNTGGQGSQCVLAMQTDTNLVIYNYTGESWETRTAMNAVWAPGFVPGGNHTFILVPGDGSIAYFAGNGIRLLNVPFNTGGDDTTPFNTTSNVYSSWAPNFSLSDFPYMPAGYFLDGGKRMLANGGNFSLELGDDCNLRSKQLNNPDGGEQVLRNFTTVSARISSCRLSLELDGSLKLADQATGVVYYNNSKSGGKDVIWILKLDPDDGTLTVSDTINPSNVLWSSTDNTIPSPSPSPSPSPPPRRKSKAPVGWIVVGVIGGVLVAAVVATGLFLCVRNRFQDPAEKAFQEKLRATGGNSQAFSETKIKQATKNYENVIGRGGFGDVYYGKLSGGQEVAAKVLSAQSHQSKREFFNEIELLSKVHHKYLVSLLGYSCTRRHQILIYEFMAGGDLRHRLQGEAGAANPLSWHQRTSIILQVAEGLEYLHDKCSPPVIHRDIKSTNILLNSNLVAKVADFGLSKLKTIGQEDATHITTAVKGTPGYLDPEYHETGLLTEKSDVYAFGVVLMEILTGRHPIYIAQRVGEAWREGQFDKLADPNLGLDYDKEELVSLVELALWCVRKNSMERPFMRQVRGRLHDLGLASSEPHQPDIAVGGFEVEGDDSVQRNSFLELVCRDSETVPLSETASSSALSIDSSGHRGRQVAP